jgi:DNA-binding CsgD family transcriptional regulator
MEATLTDLERNIAILVARGFKNREIAEKLAISDLQVKNHLLSLFAKLGVADRLELAMFGLNFEGGVGVRSVLGPRLPYRPPRGASAEPPEDPYKT